MWGRVSEVQSTASRSRALSPRGGRTRWQRGVVGEPRAGAAGPRSDCRLETGNCRAALRA